MGTKATRKDFYMEIRKSPGRFLSIFLIVALGVAFFSGIRASEPSMRITGDAYFDDARLMDIKGVSNLGITEDDVRAIEDVEGVAKAEGSYSSDFLCNTEDKQYVFHVMALQDDMNQVEVTEGRLPEKTGECLMDADTGYQVGDEIRLTSGNEDPLEDTLKTDTYTVVGLGSSPCYISFGRGSTTIGSGSIDAFMAVPEDTFCMDVYSEVYVQVEGAEELTAYTDEYDDLVEEVLERIEDITGIRGEIRRQEILDEAQEKIDEARQELADGKTQADQELGDAWKELEDAQAKIDDARAQIVDGKEQIASAKTTLSEKQKELDDAREEYDSGKKQWEEGLDQYEQGMAEFSASKPGAEEQIRQGEEGLAAFREGLDESWVKYEKMEEGILQLEASLADPREQIAALEQEIETLTGESSNLQQEAATLSNEVTELTEESGKLQEETEDLMEEVAQCEKMLESYDEESQEYQDCLKRIEECESRIEECKGRSEECTTRIQECNERIDACTKRIKECGTQIQTDTNIRNEIQEQTADYEAQLAELQQLAPGVKAELEAQENTYQAMSAELEAAKQQLADGEQELLKAKSALDSSKSQLDSARSQIESGQAQIDAGWSEIAEQEKTLEDGEAEIAENESKLEEGRQEYEDGKAEAEEEIADGERKIAEAEEELADIEEAKWYVYDRSTLPSNSEYGENADRMRAIGRVFPVLFFLVAALISLTSMTRMVEEQRIEIGTMKALGYDKFTVAAKYLGYALLATVGGSIVGVLIGEKLFPYIIIYAYGIVYPHVDHILVPYAWSYAVQASLAALACTLLATLFACYKELEEQPASLMRPPAPKKGKRVFLEYVKVIWKRLNFSWKSTVRNLLRYKKRFFMTIFGIGGCMALMLVGYGIKDSVFEIADIQYAEIQMYDGSAYLQENATEEDREEMNAFLEQDPDIEAYMDAYMKAVTLTGEEEKEVETYVTVLSEPERSCEFVDFHDRKSKETYQLSDQGAIISEKTAKLLGAKTGDTILVEGDDGEKEVVIEHICENYMGHYIYLTPEYYESVFGETPEFNCIFFIMPENYSKEQIETAGQEIVEQEEVLSISYMHDIEKQLNDILGSLNLVIVVLIVSAGMLAFVVLYNLNTINITERKRELATLKVLGFYDLEVAQYVYRENILLTLIGAMVGAGLGKLLHMFVIQTVEVETAMFGRIINLPSYLYSLLFTIAFSMIVNGVMFFKLRKIDMVESLKSIE